MSTVPMPAREASYFTKMDPSELRSILQTYHAHLTHGVTDTPSFSSAELACTERLLNILPILDFKSGANSPFARRLPQSTAQGRSAYWQVLLSSLSSPALSSFAKVGFMVEAELRTAVLFNDLIYVRNLPRAALAPLASDPVVKALCDAATHVSTHRGCPTASALAAEAEKRRPTLQDARLVEAHNTLLEALNRVKLAEHIFCHPEFLLVVECCPQTAARLRQNPKLTEGPYWQTANQRCRALLKAALPLLDDVKLPPSLECGRTSMLMIMKRGWDRLPIDMTLAQRLWPATAAEDMSSVDEEVALLADAAAKALAETERFVEVLQTSVSAYRAMNPLDTVLRLYGVTASRAAAHAFDVIQGSVMGRRGLQFEEMFVTDHISVVIEQVVAPDCAAETGFSSAEAIAWCTWCLKGRQCEQPVPDFASERYGRADLPVYLLATGVKLVEVRTAASSERRENVSDLPVTRGELDGLILDERTGDALFLVEVKLNVVDIGKAHAQREKVFKLLDEVWGVAGAHVDPTAPAAPMKSGAPRSSAVAASPTVELWFSRSDRRSCDLFRRHFTESSRETRWIFVTQIDASDGGWARMHALPAASNVRHVLEQCLATVVGLTAQYHYGRFASSAILQLRHLPPNDRFAHIKSWKARDAPKTKSFELFREMLLCSVFCHNTCREWKPYSLPFVETAFSGDAASTSPTAGPGSDRLEYASSERVLAVLRQQADIRADCQPQSVSFKFAYPIYETFAYDMRLVAQQLSYYEKRCGQKGKAAADVVTVVRELVKLGSLRSLVVLLL